MHMYSDIIKNRNIYPSDFIWKKFKPSNQTKEALVKLFSLIYKDFEKNISIKMVEWDKYVLRVSFRDNSWKEDLFLEIKDNDWKKECGGAFCNKNLCLWIHSVIQNKTFIRLLTYFNVKGEKLNLHSFLTILSKDVKAKKEYYQVFLKPARPPFSIIQDWSHPLQKIRFIINEWFVRNSDQSINLNIPKVSIHHSERECQWIWPNSKNKVFHFFNFPRWYYENLWEDYYYLSEEEKKEYIVWENDFNGIWINTDLNENDIIMWEWTAKLTEAIDYAISKIEENNIKMLSFNCCCVPRIVGDDVYSVLERAKKKISIPFVFKWQLEKTPYEQKIMLLEEYIKKLDTRKTKKLPYSISLFWYKEDLYQKDLWNILRENGIKINSSFVPTIDIRLLECMYKSELFVFSPNKFQKEIFEYPFQNIWIPYISPKYPYWLENTINWLSQIMNQFWKKYNPTPEIQEVQEKYNKKVNYVKSKWFKVWIAFLSVDEIEKFFSCDYTNNIDVVEFILEMGFEIHFFVYNHNLNFQIVDALLSKKIGWWQKKYKLHFFPNESQMYELIKDSKVDLFYSDIYFDERISNMWMNQLNLRNFYVWFSWALKTMSELISLCEMWFYKKYSTYFTD